METAVDIVVPVCVCVILPIAIVWIVFNSIINRTNKKTLIILEAIKNNPTTDTKHLLESFRKTDTDPYINLARKLLRGSIFTLLGIAFAFLGAFGGSEKFELFSWVACGVFGAVGIGFLITYWFTFKNIDKIKADKD
ncbi:MAG: hypothetical protein J1F12_04500 [Muribaculaceae bacterium]|nr:hypothetical protein [Muribaculaceae bacterium]